VDDIASGIGRAQAAGDQIGDAWEASKEEMSNPRGTTLINNTPKQVWSTYAYGDADTTAEQGHWYTIGQVEI